MNKYGKRRKVGKYVYIVRVYTIFTQKPKWNNAGGGAPNVFKIFIDGLRCKLPVTNNCHA